MLKFGSKLIKLNAQNLQRIPLLAQQTKIQINASYIHSSLVSRNISNVNTQGSLQGLNDSTLNNESVQVSESFSDSVSLSTDFSSSSIGTLPVAETSPELLTSFADYGLGGYVWPSQFLQSLMEVLNVSIGLPWIPTIMTTCVILRTIAIPFYAKMQVFHTKSHNCMPEQV